MPRVGHPPTHRRRPAVALRTQSPVSTTVGARPSGAVPVTTDAGQHRLDRRPFRNATAAS